MAAEWLLYEAEELRLHGRLVAQPLAGADVAVVTGLRELVPVLSGLLGVLAQTLPKRQVA